MSINDCRIITLPKIADPRGNITFIEGGEHVPFDISRAYYLYDVPGGAERGGHAHGELSQLIVAMSGSFDIAPGMLPITEIMHNEVLSLPLGPHLSEQQISEVCDHILDFMACR